MNASSVVSHFSIGTASSPLSAAPNPIQFGGKQRSVFTEALCHSARMDTRKTVLPAAFRLLYLILFLVMDCWAAVAQTTTPAQRHTAIVFYANQATNDPFWPVLFASLEEDLSTENTAMRNETIHGAINEAKLDRQPAFFRKSDLTKGIDFADVIEVTLLGRCDVLPQAYRPLAKGPLGWVKLVSGEIQPFIFIDCTRLAQVIGPAALGMGREERRQAMTQAIAHVLMHEWIHIATQSTQHGTHGITQAELTVHELITPPTLTARATDLPSESRSERARMLVVRNREGR
jgi:hypothetical protein